MNDNVKASENWLWGAYSPLGLSVALIAFLADQLHKWWMLSVWELQLHDRIFVTSFYNLVYYSNKGISFSMLQMDGAGQYLLSGFALIVSIAMAVWLAKSGDSRLMAISVGLIIGGALGNALDRLHLGGVADFFEFHAYGFHWPAFNIADAAIVAGVGGLLYDLVIPSRKGAANQA